MSDRIASSAARSTSVTGSNPPLLHLFSAAWLLPKPASVSFRASDASSRAKEAKPSGDIELHVLRDHRLPDKGMGIANFRGRAEVVRNGASLIGSWRSVPPRRRHL